MATRRTAGRRLRRPDAESIVRGTAGPAADLPPPGCLFGRILRSPHAHARLLRIDLDAARRLPGVHAVLAAADIPGKNLLQLLREDQPCLAQEVARHAGEPVAIVAAETAAQADAALRAIEIEYEPLPEPPAAIEGNAGADERQFELGRTEELWSRCDLVVRETYVSPCSSHAAVEPLSVLACPGGDDRSGAAAGIELRASTTRPSLVRRAVARVLGISPAACRVSTPPAGCGGDRDAALLPVAALAALAALRTGRAVQCVERASAVGCGRHAHRIEIRSGCARDGVLVCAEIQLTLGAGAYAGLSPRALHAALLSAAGPYRWQGLRIAASLSRTHTPPCPGGAADGEAVAAFAVESQLDLMAARLGLNPIEVRRRNLPRADGQAPPCAGATGEATGFEAALQRAEQTSEWRSKRLEFKRSRGILRHGIGLALSGAAVGLPTPGEPAPGAEADVVVHAEGSVTIRLEALCEGSSGPPLLARIAADALGCPSSAIRSIEPRPAPPGAAACPYPIGDFFLAGHAVLDACGKLRGAMDQAGVDRERPWTDQARDASARGVGLTARGTFAVPTAASDPAKGPGAPPAAIVPGATVAEVEVDTETGEIEVTRIWSAHGVGHPLLPSVLGQELEGRLRRELGEAFRADSRPALSLPAPEHLPRIVSILTESATRSGPAGTQGLPSGAAAGLAPAIANAIFDACGVRLTTLPFVPERCWKELERGTRSRQAGQQDTVVLPIGERRPSPKP